MMNHLLVWLYVSMFLTTLGVGLYNPLVPLFALQLGATYFDLGIIGTVFALPYVALPAVTGLLSDRINKRYLFLIGIAGSAIATFLFTQASTVSHVVAIRFLGGAAYAFLWPVAEAIVAETTAVEKRTKVMGHFSFSWSLGFLVGPPLGGFIHQSTDFQTLFMISLAVGLAAVAAFACGLRALRRSTVLTPPRMQRAESRGWSMRTLLPVFVVIIPYSWSMGVFLALFPAYASGFQVSSFEIGLLFATFGTVRTATMLQASRFTRKGESAALTLMLALLAIASAGIAFTGGFWVFLAWTVPLGVAMGVFAPITLGQASRAAKPGREGVTMGLTESVFGAGMTSGSFVGGLTAETAGANSPYITMAALTVVAAALHRTMQLRRH